MQRAVLGIVIILYLFGYLSHAQEADYAMQCLECHEPVLHRKARFEHLPFAQRRCLFCHIKPDNDREPASGEDIRHGNGLRTRHIMGISLCHGCHPKEKLGISHPVGVYPTGNMRIPEGLPTDENGRLLCITCHSPHGSDEESLGRRPVSAQLCVACHGEDYLQ